MRQWMRPSGWAMAALACFAGQAQAQKVQDWPNLARYAAEDQALGAPAPGQHRVIFLGDSITDSWSGRFATAFPGKPYLDRGISGQTTPQMLLRFQQDVLALHPAAVVILAGINDIAGNTGPETEETIENNFRSMVTLAKAAHLHVVLCSLLPADRLPWNPSVIPTEKVRALNQWLEALARREGLVYVDFYSAMTTATGGLQPALAKDAVHPNDSGYAVMEPLVEAGIRKALSRPLP